MATRALRVSGMQMLIGRDVAENEKKILDGIRRAAEDGAEFLLTPEGSLSGYWAGFDTAEVDEALGRGTSEAKRLGVGLALGTCIREPEDGEMVCRNQVRIYAPDGELLGVHSKILRCSPLDKPESCEMADYETSPLRTFEWNGVRFGALICNDMWATPGCTTVPNPFLAWQLKQMGAEVILHAINSGTEQFYTPFHESSVALWARSLGIHIVEANAAGIALDPVNARLGVVGPSGEYLVEASRIGEQYFAYTIELE